MIASYMDCMDIALDPGDDAVESWKSRLGEPVGDCDEFVASASCERATYGLLALRQNVDAGTACPFNARPSRRVLVGKKVISGGFSEAELKDPTAMLSKAPSGLVAVITQIPVG